VARRFRVKLNLDLLIAHLTREERKPVTRQQAIVWLGEAGFSRIADDVWDVFEPDLGQLEPSEVLEMRELDAQP